VRSLRKNHFVERLRANKEKKKEINILHL